ncbi:MAG: Hint domain-containing protein [Acidocella sp.]|nr:Hint domain-containing protein [Acidocella sp.]
MSHGVTSETFTGQGLIHPDWLVAGEWSGGVVPVAGVSALVNAADVLIDPLTNLSANITLQGGAELIGNGAGFAFTPQALLQADDNNALFANGAIVNEGVISVAGPGATLTVVVQAGSEIASQYGLSVASFENAGTVLVQNAATLDISGTQFSNIGTVIVDGAALNVLGGWVDGGQGAFTPGGTIELGQGAMASFNEGITGQTFLFSGSATLTLGDPLDVSGVAIAGFGDRDVILTNSLAQAESLLAGGLLFTTALPPNETLQVQAIGLGAEITLASSAHAITLDDNAPCFARGTGILTPHGYVPVEQLRPGDQVLTHRGALAPVQWVGWRTIDLAAHRRPEAVRPVRICKDALGEGLPARDIVLSPDHALLLHGQLVPVKLLTNGATIKRETSSLAVTYFHIELARHDIILAEHLAVETYLDTGNRSMFATSQGQPHAAPVFGRGKQWDAQAYADLCLSGPVLREIRREIFSRATALGFQRRQDTRLHLVETANGEPVPMTIRCAVSAPGFRLPVGHAGRFVIQSGQFIPAELSDGAVLDDDWRCLGVAIGRVKLGFAVRPIEALAVSGVHPRGAGDSAVWTDGNAVIAVPLEARFIGLSVQGFPVGWVRSA